jgi:hypothetical protein
MPEKMLFIFSTYGVDIWQPIHAPPVGHGRRMLATAPNSTSRGFDPGTPTPDKAT